ncbi:MAG: ribonuclease HI [Actinobacteria bacterium]|jgi:ribonuclease HI|nr:ribonuclease HI [Actinomycetota bacterium]
MSDPTASSCRSCGQSFTPSADLLARFPGWTPRECPRCYGGAKRGGRGGGVAASIRAGEQQLTLAQVLERYDAGPDDGVFTDGSASPNPGPGGWGAVYVVAGEVIGQDHGHEAHTTNNRMELTAVLHGVELVPTGTPAVVYSDSNLVVRTINEWAAGWAARGWRRKTGPVENLDLVQPLYERVSARPELELRWIRAHVGNRWNEYADALATAYARDRL